MALDWISIAYNQDSHKNLDEFDFLPNYALPFPRSSMKHDCRIVLRYIECAEYLIEKCRTLHKIKGAQKLERKCIAELKFLKSLAKKHVGFDKSHLRSSNLSHYLGIIHAAQKLPHVTQILQAFRCPGRNESLHVDVVAGHGNLWVKVIARKGQALHLIWAGQGQYGERDILLQAEDFSMSATVYLVNFVTPKVVFAFYNGVTSQMTDALQKKNCTVLGEIVEVSSDVEQKLAMLNVDIDQSFDSDLEYEYVDSGCDTMKEDLRQCLGNSQADTNTAQQMFKVSTCKSSTNSDRTVTMVDSNRDHDTGLAKLQGNFEDTTADKEHVHSKINYGSNSSPAFQSPTSELICDNSASGDAMNKMPYKVAINCDMGAKNITLNNPYGESVSINHPISHLTGVSNRETCMSISRGNCIGTNLSISQSIQEKQFLSGSGSVNKLDDKTKCAVDDWMSVSLEAFISNELLSSDSVNYSVLDEILAENNIQSIDSIRKINLDVSTLITLVSAVTHGRCYFMFQEPILSEQAAEERKDPVMPKLLKFMEGKKLYACQTAVDSFKAILDLLGGELECALAKDLMERVTIVPDNSSFRTRCLPKTGKIKDRSKIIFGTGDSLEAVTMTANSGFVRAAQHQGVLFAVYEHASRALTEQKEKTAESINV